MSMTRTTAIARPDSGDERPDGYPSSQGASAGRFVRVAGICCALSRARFAGVWSLGSLMEFQHAPLP